METQRLRFTIVGTIEVPADATFLYNYHNEIRGFKLASGEEVLSLVALEVDEGKEILYTDELMASKGCQVSEYHETRFEVLPFYLSDEQLAKRRSGFMKLHKDGVLDGSAQKS